MTTEVSPFTYSVHAFTNEGTQALSSAAIVSRLEQTKSVSLFLALFSILEEQRCSRIRLQVVKSEDGEHVHKLLEQEGLYQYSEPEDYTCPFPMIELVRCEPIPQEIGNAAPKTSTESIKTRLFLAVITNIFCVIFGKAKPKRLETYGQNVFDTGIYNVYLMQLKEFVNGLNSAYPLLFTPDASPKQLYQHRAIYLVNHILQINEKKTALLPNAHAKTLNFLRFILRQSKSQGDATPIHKEIAGFCRELARWMFTGPNLESHWSFILAIYVPELRNGAVQNVPELASAMYRGLRRLAGSPQTQEHTDLHIMGYVPSMLWTVQHEGKVSQALRMPNGTFRKENENSYHFSLLPELKEFLRALNAEGKRLLYINFMRTVNVEQREIYEGSMSSALHYAEFMPFGNAIDVFSFDRNSSFYFANDGIEQQPTNDYKKSLLFHLFNTNSEQPCRWSCRGTTFTFTALQQKVEAIIEAVHAHYFENSTQISQKMRQVFNELVFIEIADELVREHRYDYFTAACQASADRGPSFTALWYLHELIKQNRHTEPQEVQRLLGMLFANAMLTEHRPPYKNRISIFKRSAKLMSRRGPMPTPNPRSVFLVVL